MAALDALGALAGPPTAIGASIACLSDPDESVRVAALHTLARVSDDIEATLAISPTISELADDPSPAIRAALACFLSSQGPDLRAVGLLEALLDSSDEDAIVAGLDAIRRLGDPIPVARIERLLSSRSPRVRAAAAASLTRSASAPALTASLIRLLDDDSSLVRQSAAGTLEAFDETPAGLVDLLSRGSERAQEVTLIALRGHGPEVRADVIEWTAKRLGRASSLRRWRLDLAGMDGRTAAAACLRWCRRSRPRDAARLPRLGPRPTANAVSSTWRSKRSWSSVRQKPAASSAEPFGPTIPRFAPRLWKRSIRSAIGG